MADLPESAILGWARRKFGEVVAVQLLPHESVARSPHTSLAFAFIDAVAQLAGGNERQFRLVWKHPQLWCAEIEALRLLADVRLPQDKVPELIAEGKDQVGRWLLVPFYDGEPIGPGQAPPDVFETIARVHLRFLGSADDLDVLPKFDLAWWERLCSTLLGGLADHWAGSAAVREALDRLPQTLIHRDLQGWSLIARPDSTTIIDWGNAFAGPPWVDLGWIGQDDPDGVTRYRRVWAEVTGSQPDPVLEAIGMSLGRLHAHAVGVFALLNGRQPDAARVEVAAGDAELRRLELALRG